MWYGKKPISYLSGSSQNVVIRDVEEIHLRVTVLLNYIAFITFSIPSVGHRIQKLDLIFE